MKVPSKDAPAEFVPAGEWTDPLPEPVTEPEPVPPNVVPFLDDEELSLLKAERERELTEAKAKLNTTVAIMLKL